MRRNAMVLISGVSSTLRLAHILTGDAVLHVAVKEATQEGVRWCKGSKEGLISALCFIRLGGFKNQGVASLPGVLVVSRIIPAMYWLISERGPHRQEGQGPKGVYRRAEEVGR